MRRSKKNMTKRQKKTLKKMKENRQIDSSNLRELIKSKLEWAKIEKVKGESAIRKIQFQVARLDGIILFIEDLLQPPLEEEKTKEKNKKK